MLRPRLRAFLAAPRPTSFFHFNRPVLNPRHLLPPLQWQIQWSSSVPRRIDSKYFSSASPNETAEIVPPRSVGYWLLGTAGLVFGIVVVGGLTRLTESGYVRCETRLTRRLSITEWKPVTGIIPPLSQEAWTIEFEKYKSTPEFKLLNSRMELEDFKSIYYMEYSHRLLGRVIGLAFVLPAAYFVIRRKVSRRFAFALGGIGVLIGFQGFLGWWMVQSGLTEEELQVQDGVPRVNQYRLAAHLGTAFAVYTLMVLSGLSVLKKNKFLRMDSFARKAWVDSLSTNEIKRFRGKVVGLSHMIIATALSGIILLNFLFIRLGALVAGLDAGLIYNEFPMMGNSLIPPLKELFNPYYTRTSEPSTLSLVLRNIGENPVLVQLDHRILAVTTFGLITLAWVSAMRRPFPKPIKNGAHVVMGFALLQAALGISTLIYLVPTHLAATHQAGSLALLTAVLVLLGRLRAPTMVRLIK